MAPGTRVTAVSILVTVLGACGGGGGGGGVRPPAEVPFTSFSAVAPNQTVVLRGDSQGTFGTRIPGTTTVTSFDGVVASSELAELRLSYDANRTLEAVRITAPGHSGYSSVSFNRSSDAFTCVSGVCGLQNANAWAIVIDPTQGGLAWEYQTFGVWNEATGPAAFRAGVTTIGNRTPDSAVPTMGTATFNGIAAGLYVDAAGTSFSTTAGMTAIANFSARSVALSTTNTQLVNLASGARTADAGLDFSGTLTYGTLNSLPRIHGGVTAPGGLEGGAAGYFYGPSAEEIGGWYSLHEGSSVRKMLGAFGGKR
jgi:hypothetical protein